MPAAAGWSRASPGDAAARWPNPDRGRRSSDDGFAPTLADPGGQCQWESLPARGAGRRPPPPPGRARPGRGSRRLGLEILVSSSIPSSSPASGARRNPTAPSAPRTPLSGRSCRASTRSATGPTATRRSRRRPPPPPCCARSPPDRIAAFLDAYAGRIEARKAEIVDVAHAETGLPKAPRLADVELPRTTAQLRQAAAAAREGSWALPTIDTKLNIRSVFASIGPGLGLRTEQLSVRLQQRRGRRLRGRDRRGQPRDREGQQLAPRHDAAVGRGGARRGHRGGPAARHRAAHLPHEPRGRRAARRRPAHGRDGLYRQPLGGPAS